MSSATTYANGERFAFRYFRRPPGWVFDRPFSRSESLTLLRESDVVGLADGKSLDVRPAAALHGRGLVVTAIHAAPLGDETPTIYNLHPGVERRRILKISSGLALANLPEVGRVAWGDGLGNSSVTARTFAVAEDQVLWCIEESWRYPNRPGWEFEGAYVVLPDRLFEAA